MEASAVVVGRVTGGGPGRLIGEVRVVDAQVPERLLVLGEQRLRLRRCRRDDHDAGVRTARGLREAAEDELVATPVLGPAHHEERSMAHRRDSNGGRAKKSARNVTSWRLA